MSNSIDDGGPAFPGEQGHTPDGTWNQTWEPGMTLRDWFAGQALNGLISNGDLIDGREELTVDWAFRFADAMLKARGAK